MAWGGRDELLAGQQFTRSAFLEPYRAPLSWIERALRASTGLGLALVHRIVEAHHGEITVEGRPGIGAAFTLILPAASDDAVELD